MTESSIKRLVAHDNWPLWARATWHYVYIYLQDVKRSDLTKQSSAMAYITLFSLVPSLAALFTLLGLFLPVLGNNAGLLEDAKQFLFKNLATGSGTQIISYLETFLAGLNLKKIGMSAFVGLLFTLVMLLRQIEEALNRIWLVSEARPMINRFVNFWLFVTLGMFGISVLIGLSSNNAITALITKKTLAAADSADNIPIISMLFSWITSCAVFFFVYKIVPNCEVKNRSAMRGAALAGTIFFILSKTYTFYVAKMSYGSVYGTLAALPIFLMWIYLCWTVVLAGALFAWRIQTGFPDLDEDKTVEAATSQIDHLRNRSIRSRLPLIVLLTIHQKFLDGSGEGLSTSDLVFKLKLPHEWIYDAIELLKDLKLVVHARVSGSQAAGGDAERWFPTNPAETISVAAFVGRISEPLHHWIETWNPDLPSQIKKVMGTPEGVTPGQTVAQLLVEAN